MRSRNGHGSHASGAVEASLNSLGGSSAALGDDFRVFLADIEDLVKASASLTGEELAHTRDLIQERIDTAKERFGVVADRVGSRARRTLAATNEYVYDEPWKAIGFGTSIGLLIGFLIARR